MKYEYGVEYPTNGQKPELSDDIMVEFKGADGVWDIGGCDIVRRWAWERSSAFRIVDERYKPKQEDNTWFERGEFPPGGTECEAVLTPCTNYGIKCIILDDKNIAYKAGKEWKTTAILYGTTFRPIRTEREKRD